MNGIQVSSLETNEKTELDQKLLEKYTTEKYTTAKKWKQWYRKINKSYSLQKEVVISGWWTYCDFEE